MSLKKIFSSKSVTNSSTYELEKEVQSEGFVKEKVEDLNRIIPDVDFTTASNFAKFGSAKKYYSDSIANIYNTYPYDGSLKEKYEWRNSSTFLDLYILDNLYPKEVGYINLSSSTNSPQYITVKGGPHTDAVNPNIYSDSKNKRSNLSLEHINGNTVEFWFKQASTLPTNYCLFDLWNSITSSANDYVRLSIENLNNGGFSVTYKSGSSGISRKLLSTASLSDHNPSLWHHYAFVFNNATCSLYVDGDYVINTTGSSTITDIKQTSLNAVIGAYKTTPDLTNTASSGINLGSGSVYGSFDEFRFWKKARTGKEIYQYKNVHVGGGTNSDEYASDLGVYLKFNEGITSNSSYDSVCLDYSGRLSNGLIQNYNSTVRSLTSAIEEYDSNLVEEKDPIIYSINAKVSNLKDFYENIGTVHDESNTSNMYRSLPSWITQEADKRNDPELENFIQILASYLDTLHMQIEQYSRIKSIEFTNNKNKTIPFYKNALSSYGFEIEDIFTDSNFFEEILSRDDETNFENSLQEVKNLIYKNIYNNLSYIYKSKGTEKAFRNLLRCYGIDDEIAKINVYSNNSTLAVEDKRSFTTVYKKYVDFNDPDRFESAVFQKNVDLEVDEKSYIDFSFLSSSNAAYKVPLTFQAEVLFPKKLQNNLINYFDTPFTTVSLFGAHTAKTDQTDLAWKALDNFNFQVYAIKTEKESPDVYFKFVTNGFNLPTSLTLTSSIFRNVYDNEKWNLSVRIKGEKDLSLNTGSNYIIEFVGINSYLNETKNEFILSSSIPFQSGVLGLSENKRVYIGSHYQDFNKNNVLQSTDVKITSKRVWLNYLSYEELKHHSYDASSYGALNPSRNAVQLSPSNTSSYLPAIDSLILNWDFTNVTSSDSSGNFIVLDASSGSVSEQRYPFFNTVIKNKHKGYGVNFQGLDTQVVNKEYVYSAKSLLPDLFNSDELIKVIDTNDISTQFSREPAPVEYFFSIEKSMYRIISEEMMKIFSSTLEFNNLICSPLENIKEGNKDLEFISKKYFDTINNNPDQEKFIEFYKWIDSSILSTLKNLIPASSNFSTNSSNIIESHVLERNKVIYRNSLNGISNERVKNETTAANINNRNPFSGWTPRS